MVFYMSRISYFSLILFLFLNSSFVFAFPIPPNDGFVTDAVGIIGKQEEGELESLLESYQTKTSNEIAVLIVDSLHGESVADTAIAIGRAWGIGGRENNNGLLLFVSYEDREVFLATGYGLEGAIPDIVAKGIIEQEILPRFREGAYGEGIRGGIDAVMKHIGGEYAPDRYTKIDTGDIGHIPLFFFGLAGLFLISFLLILFKEFIAHTAPTPSFWEGGLIGGFFGSVFGFFFGWILSIPLFIVLGCIVDALSSWLYQRSPSLRQWVQSYRRRRQRPRGGWWFFGGRGGGGGGFGGFGGGSFGGGGAGGKW